MRAIWCNLNFGQSASFPKKYIIFSGVAEHGFRGIQAHIAPGVPFLGVYEHVSPRVQQGCAYPRNSPCPLYCWWWPSLVSIYSIGQKKSRIGEANVPVHENAKSRLHPYQGRPHRRRAFAPGAEGKRYRTESGETHPQMCSAAPKKKPKLVS